VIIGRSPAIQTALRQAERFAPLKLPILLVGPTGTGKDLLARHIHALSGRSGKLVALNCGALPRDMAESLLFGHGRGAFTGADRAHVGHIERSHGGTLFLDELDSLPLDVQVKLLRVLDDGRVLPLGEEGERPVDLRVIAAAQENLFQALADREFREDLFARVKGVLIRLPALAERPEDIVPLAEHFARQTGRVLEPGVERILLNYAWPHNARELRLAIEYAGGLVADGTLPPGALAEAIAMGAPSELTALGIPRPRRAATLSERHRLVELCVAHRGEVREIAEVLGIRRSALYERLRRHEITLGSFRTSGLSTGRPADGPDSGREIIW
jgi:DNA-binding NtrC family response regulator